MLFYMQVNRSKYFVGILNSWISLPTKYTKLNGQRISQYVVLTYTFFLVLRDDEVYMYVVYIWKWSSAHALEGVSGVASFITTDEQLQ